MHKIKKGIKKKIKGKKDKDSEIFTPEEYEKYKKQKEEELKRQQETTQEVQEEDQPEEENHEVEEETFAEEPVAEASSESPPKKDDWRNFLSATDTVLKKTSVNLEHIKESSYFQAKKVEEPIVENPVSSISASPVPSAPSVSTSKRWVDLDKGGIDDSSVEEEEVDEKETQENLEESPKEEKQEEKDLSKNIVLKPIEDLPIVAAEDYADVFDTTYVDTVESGEIQLYQIPDSPILEELNEPDPFDTSNVDKVLHIEKKVVEKPKKESVTVKPVKKKKNLVNLGCAVDVLTRKTSEAPAVKKNHDKELNLLADFEDREEESVEKTQREGEEPCEESKSDKNKVEEEVKEKCVLDEIIFGEGPDTILSDPLAPPELQPILKPKEAGEKEADGDKKECEESALSDLSELLDPLAASEDKTHTQKESHLQDLVAEFDVIDKVDSTSKPLVVKSDAIDDNIKDEFDAEFAVLAAESIAKEKDKAIDEIGALDEDDPFDTSSVIKVLGEPETQEEEKDPFDADFASEFIKEQKPARPQPPRPAPPKTSPLTLLDEDPFDTSVASKVLPSDPFEAVEDSISLPESLKPQSGQQIAEEPDNFDPFDTSVAESFGKTELKVLEGELLSDISDKTKAPELDTDFDFDPRAEETKHLPPLRPPSPACLLTSANDNPELPVLIPQALPAEVEDFDPFDTSIAEKVHIKTLEAELLSDSQNQTLSASKKPPPRPASPSCLLSSLQSSNNSVAGISSIAKKALAEDFDPFDTSIADRLDSGGKADEVQSLGQDKLPKNLNLPLKPPRPASPVCLLATTPLDENPTLEPTTKPSFIPTEEEFDPFDTSIANQFGKTELKVLETELFTKSTNEPEIDNDFDPRAHTPKSNKPSRPVSPACLLTSGVEEVEQQLPPLSPVTPNKQFQNTELDPFDTSIANRLGKTEIEILESDLIRTPGNTSEILSRTVTEGSVPKRPPPPPQCAFATTPTDSNPALQPFSQDIDTKRGATVEEIDPFDTSIANQFGRTELKSLEETLLAEDNRSVPTSSVNLKVTNKDSLFDISPSADNLPVLQPTLDSKTQPEEIDPFDTSIASNFGKTELKVLESELLVDSGTKRNISDDEFDPREQESTSVKRKASKGDTQSILDCEVDLPIQSLPVLQANTVIVSSSLEPVIDPFDTSIAENIGPGKEELKILGKELLQGN